MTPTAKPRRAGRGDRHDRRRPQHRRQGAGGPRLLRRRQPAARACSRTSSGWSTRARGSSQPIAVVVDVRSGAFFESLQANLARGATGRHATLVFLEATDDVLVRRQEAARRPHPLQGERPAARRAAARARGAGRPARRRRPGHRHLRPQRPPAHRPDRRGVRDTATTMRLKVTRGQLRLQVRHPGRRRLRGRHAVPAQPALGPRAARRAPGATADGRRRTSSEQAGAEEFLDALRRRARGRRRRVPARGQAVHAGGDRLHRRQAPQRGDDRGDRPPAAAPRASRPARTHRDLGRE